MTLFTDVQTKRGLATCLWSTLNKWVSLGEDRPVDLKASTLAPTFEGLPTAQS